MPAHEPARRASRVVQQSPEYPVAALPLAKVQTGGRSPMTTVTRLQFP